MAYRNSTTFIDFANQGTVVSGDWDWELSFWGMLICSASVTMSAASCLNAVAQRLNEMHNERLTGKLAVFTTAITITTTVVGVISIGGFCMFYLGALVWMVACPLILIALSIATACVFNDRRTRDLVVVQRGPRPARVQQGDG